MVSSKTGLKVSIISILFLAGSVTSTAQADHNSHSILPYVAIGIFASILNNNSHSHRYSYKKKRHYGNSGYNGHSNYGHGGHRNGRYSSNYQHSHNNGGYRYKSKKH